MIRNVVQIPYNSMDVFLKNYFDTKVDYTSVNDSKINYPLDIIQSDSGLIIQIACVGADLDDISITTALDTLRIKYDKPKLDDSYNYVFKSIAQRSFDLGYKVSAKYDLNRIEAKLSKGLLSISIPYEENQQPKTINIISE
jgi:HSP20 family molecular chaperone IbpA